jgi:YggT family protein
MGGGYVRGLLARFGRRALEAFHINDGAVMGQFIYAILDGVLRLLILAIIVNAVFSWLIAFNVVNLRHPFVRQVAHFFEAVTDPVLWPFRQVVPALGGIDITPILAILVLQAADSYLLPWLFGPLIGMLGG